VQGAALRALGDLNPTAALTRAKAYEVDAPASLSAAMLSVYAQQGGSAQWAFIRDRFDAATGRSKFSLIGPMTQMLGRLDDPKAFSEDVTRLQQLALTPQLKAYGIDKAMVAAIQKGAEAQKGKPSAAQNQAAANAAVQAIQAAK
jgi:aminopeptidase N